MQISRKGAVQCIGDVPMVYQFGKIKRRTGPDRDPDRKHLSSVRRSLPNSAMLKEMNFSGIASSIPNSVMRTYQEQRPAAEEEADRLSADVTSATPDALREEMGSRLGADFSDVQFHSDSLSMNRSRAMGARAWAQGSDVYFGKGGFDPKVAAHELVHTVQQGAVKGSTMLRTWKQPTVSLQHIPGIRTQDI